MSAQTPSVILHLMLSKSQRTYFLPIPLNSLHSNFTGLLTVWSLQAWSAVSFALAVSGRLHLLCPLYGMAFLQIYMYVLLHCFTSFKHLLKCHHSGLGSMESRLCGSGTQNVNLAVLLVSTCVEGSGRKLKWAERESNLWNKPNDSFNYEWALELKWPVRAVLHWAESSVLFILFFDQDWPWVRGLFAAELILEAAVSISRSWGISPPLKGGVDIL